ncbi:BTAD domain-containing putative transcriptional regulator [Streptomyces sp. MBT33]|uniref:AfsR/SARP family transcriptional regulator n=1 Tax=Streptomyces sp. MBT33 TaxID=1488363 RepID=UPI001909F6C0|nr:BTAD domain-containing putative transcriptional regulator [Streptomyces sp. MBT33]MBK3639915.1 tetratricopeptide repeat protein [Streptomyces sp. MBT33]
MVRLRLLGPVELAVGDVTVDIGPPQRRTVLAALAVDTGRPVGVDVLVGRVWGTDPPEGARRSLYAHITRIRHACDRMSGTSREAVRLTRRSDGYVLQADRQQVDVHRFRQLIDRARDARVPDGERAALLGEALGLWRGEPLSGLDGPWAEQMRQAWRREQVDATIEWARVQARLGAAAATIGPLSSLLDDFPLVEPLAEALMRALHDSGRDAEALQCYASMRHRLADELGTDPGSALRETHQAILRGNLSPSAPPQQPAPAPPPPPKPRQGTVPAQLPVAVSGFTGRREELAELDALLESAQPPAPVVISAVSGTAGVGKTTLAVHWAHRVRKFFPDGQLYVNLRGFDPGGTVVDPAEAVRGFLDAFAVPAARIPPSLDAQAALYRSLLADRRVLIVLDNARDAEQVRPLLPGTPGCLALVTSRNRLTSLAAVEGARLLSVDVLSPDESRSLLADRLDTGRITAEPDAVAEIVARCAGLPLALAVLAARAAAEPRIPLATLADELRESGSRLDALDAGDSATRVRAVFSWSYASLAPAAQRLFRLLGLHHGPDISAAAAASLTGVPPTRVRAPLAELTRTHLLTEHLPSRYASHDLLRAYAAELARTEDGDAERRQATHRVLDHYLFSALHAQRLLGPPADPVLPSPAQPEVTPEEPADREGAMAWFTAEHPVLLAAVDQAAQEGFDVHVWQLAAALTPYHQRKVLWSDWAGTHMAGLAAARRAGDKAGQACAHRNIGNAESTLGRPAEARTHLERAARLYQQIGDQLGAAHTHLALGRVSTQQGRVAEGLRCSQQAVRGFRAAGDRAWQALALNNVGWEHVQLGEYGHAIDYCEQALALIGDTGHVSGEAHTWDTLGVAHHHLGEHGEAAACYEKAAALFHHIGDLYYEADILAHLGDTHYAARNQRDARDAWTRSLALFEQLDHRDTEALRARLEHHLHLDPSDTVLPDRD